MYVFHAVLHFSYIKTDTRGIKLTKLRIRIKNKWLKKTMFKKSYEKLYYPLLRSITFLYSLQNIRIRLVF